MAAATPRVLVIDDEQGFRDLLRFELQNLGYEVFTADNGEDGIKTAREKTVDVVVSDLTMPRLGGLEALSAIKANDPKVEVIIITGHATIATAIESMKRGAYDYIMKPFQLQDLRRLVDRALDKRRLNQRVNELQELNRLKSEFLANMSHELRTPLNAIVGYNSLMLDGVYGDVTEKQKQGLRRVEANAKNLLQLINNILDLSKLTAGRMPVCIERFRVADLVREVAETTESLARQKGLELSWDAPQDLSVKSDKTKVKQLLINLVGNAVKFTAAGSVRIVAERLPGEPRLRLSVRDTGIGIKEEDIPLIFEKFTQLDAASTREYSGTGLGLSICKKLSELLGGDIGVESVPGRGSVFSVTLPLDRWEETPEGPAKAPEPDHQAGGRKTLLAIDDDPEVLNLLRDSLQGSGFSFVGAQSGEEGIALARRLKPSVITLDIMMPHQDGWSVLQSLKSDPLLRAIPVMIVSIMENKSLGFSLGVADYLVKPFTRQNLLDKLGTLETARPTKVMVLDDDEFMSGLLQEVLQTQGYEVEVCGAGKQALERLRAWRPDVLFLDLMMPDISGLDVLQAMESDPALGKTRVIVVTGKHLSTEETHFLEKRVEMVVRKGSKSLPEIIGALKERLADKKEVLP